MTRVWTESVWKVVIMMTMESVGSNGKSRQNALIEIASPTFPKCTCMMTLVRGRQESEVNIGSTLY